MAGGYDNRVAENREHFDELTTLTTELGLNPDDEVTFLKSPSDAEKLRLLKTSNALLYTPSGNCRYRSTGHQLKGNRKFMLNLCSKSYCNYETLFCYKYSLFTPNFLIHAYLTIMYK